MMRAQSAATSIDFLADHPAALPKLARWLFDEWGVRSSMATLAGMRVVLGARMKRNSVLIAFVAPDSERPQGTASLKLREVQARPGFDYWLGPLFVHNRFRGRGIGTALVEAVERHAAGPGIGTPYLYTSQEITHRWYLRLGWSNVGRPSYRGRSAIIMARSIKPAGHDRPLFRRPTADRSRGSLLGPWGGSSIGDGQD